MVCRILFRCMIFSALPLLASQIGHSAELALYPTYSAVGVELSGSRGLTAAVLDWRPATETEWRKGVEMSVNGNGLAHGSIWPVQQGARVEVRVTAEAGGRSVEHSASTVVPRLVTEAGGRQLLVSADNGNDSGTGSRTSPLRTVRQALKNTRPGDTVVLQKGIYQEGDLGEGVAGTPERPIVIRSAPGQRAVLDSSSVIRKQAEWRDDGNGIFSHAAAFSGDYIYAAQDGQRMYRYFRREDLQQDPHGVRRAFFADTDAGRIYVRTGDASAPGGHEYNVSRHDWGFYLHNSRHVVVRDLEIRNFGGACIRISGRAIGNVIYRNELRNSGNAVFLKNDTTDLNAIWNNHLHEPGIGDFSWTAIKQSGVGRQGISATYAGRGTSVCYNRIHDWFDGVVLLSWKKPDQMQLNRDSDVCFNDIWNIGDDAIELDGGGVNMRAHGNRIRNAHSAISLAPIERGPVYVTRNHASFHTLMFKCSSGAPSTGRTLCWHNSGYTLNASNDGTMIRFNELKIADSNREFLNNAIVGSEYSVHRGRKGHVLNGNCYFNTPQTGFRKFTWDGKTHTRFNSFQSASGQEQRGLYADPKFVSTPDLAGHPTEPHPRYDDSQAGDLQPRSNSPLIDRGIAIRGINDQHAGAGPDIGAFELDER